MTDVSPIFCDFIERLLSKQPEHRFDSWGDILIEIDRISQNCPLSVGPLDLTKAVSTMKRSERRQKKHQAYAKLEALHLKEHTKIQVSAQKLHEAYENIEINKLRKRMISRLVGIASAIIVIALIIGISIGVLINKPAKVDESITQEIVIAFEDINKKHFSKIITDKDAINRYDALLETRNVDPSVITRIQIAKNDVSSKYERNKKRALDSLKKKAEFFAANGDVHKAVNMLEYYNGDFADETVEERIAFSKDIAKRYGN
jgi:hypothetical protein